MRVINHVLIAVDLSDASLEAARRAVGLAQTLGARVTVLHVDESPTINLPDPSTMIAFQARVEAARQTRLGLLLDSLDDDAEVEILAEAGVPADVILEVARRLHVGLIVTASRGAAATRGPLIGSTTLRVIRHAETPVLVYNPASLEHPSRGLTHLLTTTDFSEESARGMLASHNLALRFGARLTITHAVRVPLVIPILPGEPPIQVPPSALEHLRISREAELREHLSQSDALENASTLLTFGDSVADAVTTLAEEQDVDMIAIPSHGKGVLQSALLGSTAQALIEVATRPVLVWCRGALEQTPAPLPIPVTLP